MRNKELLRLIAGFRKFREKYYLTEGSVYERLSTGQTPKTLIIGCSDSRVDPAILTSASPGELFTVRNVANLVPPFESTAGLHGVSSAIEFAVVNLKVENIIVLGHQQCGGIRALMTSEQNQGTTFIGQWVQIAKKAKERVLAQHKGADIDTLCRHCEMESIITSLENLRTFPFIIEAMRDRNISLIGAYFDLELGQMFEYDDTTNSFRAIAI